MERVRSVHIASVHLRYRLRQSHDPDRQRFSQPIANTQRAGLSIPCRVTQFAYLTCLNHIL